MLYTLSRVNKGLIFINWKPRGKALDFPTKGTRKRVFIYLFIINIIIIIIIIIIIFLFLFFILFYFFFFGGGGGIQDCIQKSKKTDFAFLYQTNKSKITETEEFFPGRLLRLDLRNQSCIFPKKPTQKRA